jgi:tRNA-Thr(GGU) m(6)t(6)A37 methyltransferase TsaA
LRLKAIATVKNGICERIDDWDKVTSELVFDKRYVKGLYRLTHFRHVWVLFGFHRERQTLMRLHPRRDASIPIVGVFATRSPTRPNKIGLTKVRLLSVKGNIVKVKGLDAFDGTPVYDIKPVEEEIDY